MAGTALPSCLPAALVAEFAVEAGSLLADLRAALAHHDVEAATHAAHVLAGGCALVGDRAGTAAARAVLAALRTGETGRARALTAALELVLRDTVAEPAR
jgi:HPt (histidine-containing phosphotransfer) domain-containing protein